MSKEIPGLGIRVFEILVERTYCIHQAERESDRSEVERLLLRAQRLNRKAIRLLSELDRPMVQEIEKPRGNSEGGIPGWVRGEVS